VTGHVRKERKETMPKRRKGKSPFICGKCGKGFPDAGELGMHVAEDHKRKARKKTRPSRKARRSSGRPSRAIARASMKCEKCGRTGFKNGHSYAAHKRYCKGALAQNAAVLRPLAGKPPFAGPSLIQSLAKMPSNGKNPIEDLRRLAAGKRQEAAEIDKLVEEFETKAKTLLG
jgi:hypothetical protein